MAIAILLPTPTWYSASLIDERSTFLYIPHSGHLQARLVYYLMNIHTQPRCIYLCRVSGQWEDS